MRLRTSFIMLVIPLLLLAAGCSKLVKDSAFYYYFNEKIYLDERRDLLFIQFEKDLPEEQKKAIVQSDASLHPWTYHSKMGWGDETYDGIGDATFAVLQSSGRISLAKRDAFRKMDGVLWASFLFEKNGQVIAVTNELIVKLNDAGDYPLLEQMADQYGCRVTDETLLMENVYVLERTRTCKFETLELVQIFHESGRFSIVDPGMIAFGAFDV